MKVLVTQSCLTLCYPMDCSLPGSSVYGILQVRTRVDCHSLLQGISQIQRSTLGLLHCRQILYWLNHQGIQGIQSHHFMATRWGNNGNSDSLYFLGLQIYFR